MVDGSSRPVLGRSVPSRTYDPLVLADVVTRKRFTRRAGKLPTSMRSQIELKCIECCGWERQEAKQCEINTCALWATNQRIFHGRTDKDQSKA